MEYIIKSGNLYNENQEILVKVNSSSISTDKKIYNTNNQYLLEVSIEEHTDYTKGDVRNKVYKLKNNQEQIICNAYPQYASGEEPDIQGWPICRMPRVDHACVCIEEKDFKLNMKDNKTYVLLSDDTIVLTIEHKGILGGWFLNDQCGFKPEVLYGIFMFCRYIEHENEFMIV